MPRLRPWLALAVLMVPGLAVAAETAADDGWLRGQLDDLVGLYRHLHTHPELSNQEVETGRRIAEELRRAGAEVTTGVGKLGVVGVIKNGPGPTVLVRADLDALPVAEQTGLPYASTATATDPNGKTVRVMHACGHDVHMTCLVGTARWLSSHRDRWSGTAVLIGQPAEEAIGGASEMLKDGLYTRFPKPDFALALHVSNDLPAGVVGYTSGPTLAGSASVDVTIRGRGGHGAAPHTTADPIVLAALAILDFQTIVSREVDPVHPAVVTVGSIQGGTKHNIIPNEVKMQMTIRYYRDDVRDLIIDGIKRRASGLAQIHRAPEPTVTLVEGTPPTINTPALVSRVVPALSAPWARRTSRRSSPSWAPRTSASTARGASRSSCSAWAPSPPSAWPAPRRSRSPRSTRPCTTPTPSRPSAPASAP